MVDFGANTQIALIALCAALFSIVVYSVGASIFGIPTSESHSLIAGLTGAAIALGLSLIHISPPEATSSGSQTSAQMVDSPSRLA